jgi:hypothetical protein
MRRLDGYFADRVQQCVRLTSTDNAAIATRELLGESAIGSPAALGALTATIATLQVSHQLLQRRTLQGGSRSRAVIQCPILDQAQPV